MNRANSRAIRIECTGGPEVLRFAERPRPEPVAGEVRIRIAAIGINRPDIQQRRGLYPPPPGASDVLGLEWYTKMGSIGGEVLEGIQRSIGLAEEKYKRLSF